MQIIYDVTVKHTKDGFTNVVSAACYTQRERAVATLAKLVKTYENDYGFFENDITEGIATGFPKRPSDPETDEMLVIAVSTLFVNVHDEDNFIYCPNLPETFFKRKEVVE